MSTPICPACGAKFSHNVLLQKCNKCGLPDEIRAMGPQVIARWKRKTPEGRKVVTLPKHRKNRNKHGRRGVKA